MPDAQCASRVDGQPAEETQAWLEVSPDAHGRAVGISRDQLHSTTERGDRSPVEAALAVVHRDWLSEELRRVLAPVYERHSWNVDFAPLDPVTELERRGLFVRTGEHVTAPEPFASDTVTPINAVGPMCTVFDALLDSMFLAIDRA